MASTNYPRHFPATVDSLKCKTSTNYPNRRLFYGSFIRPGFLEALATVQRNWRFATRFMEDSAIRRIIDGIIRVVLV